MSEALRKLVPFGLRVSEKEVRGRIGFSEPEKGDSILQAAPAAVPSVTTDKARRLIPACSRCGGGHAIAADGWGELDTLIEEALDDWQEDLNPIIKPLQSLFERATSYAQLERGLDDMIAKMDVGPLADRLAKLQMIARGLGDTGDGGR